MNERLQEINNIVDEYFANRKTDEIPINNKYFDQQQIFSKNNDSYNVHDKMIEFDKMIELDKIFNINKSSGLYNVIRKSKYCFYNIKYHNKNINDMRFLNLSQLFLSIVFILNKKLLVEFSKKYLIYHNYYEQYTTQFYNIKQKKEIFNYMNGDYKSYNKMVSIIKLNKSSIIVNDNIEVYKKSIYDIKNEIVDMCTELFNTIDKHDDNYICYFNIINTYLSKIDKMYKFISKFNIPEMKIYNFIIDKMKTNDNILNVFTHFTLPTKRSKKCLSADLMVIVNFDNDLHFIIIEYDGPTHSNINDFRFNDTIILCDINKNNYCVNNNISLIRFDYRISLDTHLEILNTLIDTICKTKQPVYHGIPSDNDYKQLLDKYYSMTNTS